MQSAVRIILSVSLMRGLGSAGGTVCSCGLALVRGSAGVWGVVCCARLTVAAASAAKANAARFTVHLRSYELGTSLQPKLSELRSISIVSWPCFLQHAL